MCDVRGNRLCDVRGNRLCDVRGNRLCDRISNCRDHLKYKWYHFLGPYNEIKYYLKKCE